MLKGGYICAGPQVPLPGYPPLQRHHVRPLPRSGAASAGLP